MATELLTSAWEPENFFETTLSADCTDSDTDIFLTGVPTNTEGTLIIDPESATDREIIYYSSKTATKVTCPANGRGYDNTTAVAHLSGTKVIMAPIADWFNSVKAGRVFDPGAISAEDINFGGAGSGIWWEEIGRTTLGSAGDTISIISLPARKYLKFILCYTGTGGTTLPTIRFNNDSGSNYANRQSASGGADATATSQTSFIMSGAESNISIYAEFEGINISAQEKVFTGRVVKTAVSGAGTAPLRTEDAVKWTNTSAQISRIDVINTGTGDFAIGSELIVLGHD